MFNNLPRKYPKNQKCHFLSGKRRGQKMLKNWKYECPELNLYFIDQSAPMKCNTYKELTWPAAWNIRNILHFAINKQTKSNMFIIFLTFLQVSIFIYSCFHTLTRSIKEYSRLNAVLTIFLKLRIISPSHVIDPYHTFVCLLK